MVLLLAKRELPTYPQLQPAWKPAWTAIVWITWCPCWHSSQACGLKAPPCQSKAGSPGRVWEGTAWEMVMRDVSPTPLAGPVL